jgi:hypothetical protein
VPYGASFELRVRAGENLLGRELHLPRVEEGPDLAEIGALHGSAAPGVSHNHFGFGAGRRCVEWRIVASLPGRYRLSWPSSHRTR